MQSTDMRIRAATSLLGLVLAAGGAGYVLGGHAVAITGRPQPPTPVIAPLTVAPEFVGHTQGTHVLWLSVGGRWRAVPP